jgi:hypothetical protein
MIANLTVYGKHDLLVGKLETFGFKVLVDGLHNWKEWFISNYKGVPHRAFFYEPYLVGSVEDIDFKMMGCPDFVIWFNEREDHNDPRWDDVNEYLKFCFNGGEISNTIMTNAKVFLGTHVVPPCMLKSKETVQGKDGLVKVLDATKHYYGFNSKLYDEQDLAIFSVTKPFVDDPFTVILKDFKKNGPTTFFADLFACEDWGQSFCDVSFLKQLWQELEIEGEFDMDELLKKRTSEFYPIDGEAKVEPVVLRKSIEECEKYII